MPNTSPVAKSGSGPFCDLACHLDEQREAILLNWRTAVEKDERISVVSKLGRVAFENSIPASLALLSQQLHREQLTVSGDSAENAAEAEHDFSNKNGGNPEVEWYGLAHGFQRWKEGYDLRQLMMETGHLHQTLVQVFNQYEIDYPDAPRRVMHRSRFLATQLIDASYLHSVGEYHRLQEAEASEIVNSLSQALETLQQWEQARGEVLRESLHDIRGNLTAIQGATSLLNTVSGNDANPQIQQSVLGILERSSETLYEMLTDLLDLARLEAGQEQRTVQPFDAARLLGDLCTSAQPLAGARDLTLTGEGASTLWVEGDALQVQRIAQNLLLNALKYTHHGGVRIGWSKVDDDAWCLSIQDTGPGFHFENEDATLAQKAAKQPVDPKAHSSGGEGVGTVIVRRLCTLLDAELKVESTIGVGTTFQVIFPTQYEVASSVL